MQMQNQKYQDYLRQVRREREEKVGLLPTKADNLTCQGYCAVACEHRCDLTPNDTFLLSDARGAQPPADRAAASSARARIGES